MLLDKFGPGLPAYFCDYFTGNIQAPLNLAITNMTGMSAGLSSSQKVATGTVTADATAQVAIGTGFAQQNNQLQRVNVFAIDYPDTCVTKCLSTLGSSLNHRSQ